MKLGLNTAILGHMNFYEAVDFASEIGYEALEVACWPQGKAERRYAGVSHINVDNLDNHEVDKILNYCKEKNIEISALAYYPNPLDEDLEARVNNINHLKKVIKAAELLNVNLVTTFVGKMQNKNLSDNIEEFKKVWPDIISYAEVHNTKVAIENCPMLFTEDEWPGGQNMFTSSSIYRKLFDILPSDYFGINFDPSHYIWQQMDYIKPIYEFKDKMFHIHFKDIKLYQDKLDDVGILAPPLQYMSPKLPGLGDVNWSKYVSALNDINFKGFACVEVEDKSFEDSLEDINKSCKLSYKYLRNYVI